MTRRILVPMDGSEKAEDGLSYALSSFPDAAIVVLHVMTPFDEWEIPEGDDSQQNKIDEWFGESRAAAEDIFDGAESISGAYDSDVTTELVIGEPWREIVSYAEDNDIDHIVMGSQGVTDEDNTKLGSVAETVMRRAPVLVSIVR